MAIKKLLTVSQLAELYNWKRATIYNKICNKSLPVVRIGRSVRFDPDELQKWEVHQDAIAINN